MLKLQPRMNGADNAESMPHLDARSNRTLADLLTPSRVEITADTLA